MSDHHHEVKASSFGNGKKTLKSYMMGLFLSLVFTLCSFAIVAKHSFSNSAIYISITILAIAQLLAQVICFLRMNMSREGRWNSMPFIFTILIVSVLVFGSLWIMVNLNYNMVH